MAEALTQYKLLVLYMLDHVDFPLTNTQISNFVLDKEYTTYFTIQQTISELISSELIRTESTHNNTHYYITDAGKEQAEAVCANWQKQSEEVYTYLMDLLIR